MISDMMTSTSNWFGHTRKLGWVVALLLIGFIPRSESQTLQAAWSLEGNASDQLGVSDGTATGILWTTDSINGHTKTVASFQSGASLVVPKTSNLDLPASGFTLMGWAKSPDFSTAPAPNSFYTLFRAGGVPNQEESAYALRFSAQGINFQISTLNNYPNYDPGYRDIRWLSDNAANSSSSHLLAANTWYHIAVTYNGTSFAAYLNGEQLNTTENPITPLIGGAPYNFGGLLHLGTPLIPAPYDPAFNGQMSDLRIYGGALSQIQIQAVISVPEPTVLCLLGFGAACGLIKHLRRLRERSIDQLL